MTPLDRHVVRGKMPFRTFGGACASLATLLATILAAISTGAVWAQASTDASVAAITAQKQAREIAHGEPARWLREDRTAAERLRTVHKEINAALQEAKGACRDLPAAERAACMSEARANHQREMAEAVAPRAARINNAPGQTH